MTDEPDHRGTTGAATPADAPLMPGTESKTADAGQAPGLPEAETARMTDDIIAALREGRGRHSAGDMARRDLAFVGPNDSLQEAFVKMQQSRQPALPVIDSSGRLVGLITPENVGEMMIIKSLRPKEGKPSWRFAHA